MHDAESVHTKRQQEVPLTERLLNERDNLQGRIDKINMVLEALQANPQVQSVLDLLKKTRCW